MREKSEEREIQSETERRKSGRRGSDRVRGEIV